MHTLQCALCRPTLGPILAERQAWRVVLNRNQNLPGKTFIALRRHSESVSDLMEEEWAELHGVVDEVTELLQQALSPDHFNYAFLGNLDRHVHLHVLPRYASPREILGHQVEDTGYPGHYALRAGPPLSEEELARVAELILHRGGRN